MQLKISFLNKHKERILKIINTLIPYIVVILAIGYLSGGIFIITQNPLPIIVDQSGQITIIYPRTNSQQTIMEGLIIGVILLILFFVIYELYQIGIRKYHTSPPNLSLALLVFALIILYFLLYVIQLSKISG